MVGSGRLVAWLAGRSLGRSVDSFSIGIPFEFQVACSFELIDIWQALDVILIVVLKMVTAHGTTPLQTSACLPACLPACLRAVRLQREMKQVCFNTDSALKIVASALPGSKTEAALNHL